ncbi:MAG: hypothetical protein J6T44_06275 [Prevotella sp.]|jgi:hypothetical protein|nr:hypothetical protein [Prevotella sp.]
MKRNTILAVIAILLLAFYYNIWLLLLLIVIPVGYFVNKYMEKKEPPKVTFANTEEVKLKYGEPDDVVVLDASRANELSALILFYTAQDVMVVAGEEQKISDMISVMPKNMATPYTVDEYAVIITTKNPQRPSIHLRVGYDGGLAREISAQIYAHCELSGDGSE